MEPKSRTVLALIIVTSMIALTGCSALSDNSVKHNVVISNNDNETHSARIVISREGEAIVNQSTSVEPNNTNTLAPLKSSGKYRITVYIDGLKMKERQFEVKNLDGDRIGHTLISINSSGEIDIMVLYQT